jgi:large subunit ribosomal protein L4
MAAALQRLMGPTSVLIVLAERDEMVERSARNLPSVKTLSASYLNVRDLLGYQRLLLPLGALDAISSRLAH